jgi:uncharacterized protein with FMN-binding domain
MEEKQKPAYFILLALSAVISAAAVVTLIPNPAASKPNVLGYRSVCSFAPAATALCALAAAGVCAVRNRLVSVRRASTRFQPPIALGAAAVVFVTLAAVFGARFGTVQSSFGKVIDAARPGRGALSSLADGTRTGTASEGEVSATVELSAQGGKVTDLQLTAGRNVEPEVASRIFEEVLAAQSSAVDVVSGATASSNVLLKAVEAAAQGAGTPGTPGSAGGAGERQSE